MPASVAPFEGRALAERRLALARRRLMNPSRTHGCSAAAHSGQNQCVWASSVAARGSEGRNRLQSATSGPNAAMSRPSSLAHNGDVVSMYAQTNWSATIGRTHTTDGPRTSADGSSSTRRGLASGLRRRRGPSRNQRAPRHDADGGLRQRRQVACAWSRWSTRVWHLATARRGHRTGELRLAAFSASTGAFRGFLHGGLPNTCPKAAPCSAP